MVSVHKIFPAGYFSHWFAVRMATYEVDVPWQSNRLLAVEYAINNLNLNGCDTHNTPTCWWLID